MFVWKGFQYKLKIDIEIYCIYGLLAYVLKES